MSDNEDEYSSRLRKLDFLPAGEAAKVVGIPESTVYSWANKGKVRSVKNGRLWIDIVNLKDVIAEREAASRQPVTVTVTDMRPEEQPGRNRLLDDVLYKRLASRIAELEAAFAGLEQRFNARFDEIREHVQLMGDALVERVTTRADIESVIKKSIKELLS